MGADEQLIDQRAMSRMLGITTKTAETWRVRGSGPRFIKVGSLVRYRKADIQAWLISRTASSTSESLPKDVA
ncbi:helix-turn-helix transcriptional regulator [Nitrospira sp. BLG_2]|uniref:helix-turn-helix transcriptional regulator n=1 Tax=Nitrospira sp. BLG_2 TaxID=3397507 RepID=UPI003B9CBB45